MATSASVTSWEQARFGTLLSYPFSFNRSPERVSLLAVSWEFHYFPSHAPTPFCKGWIVLQAFIHTLACCNTTEHWGAFSQMVLLLRDSLKLCTLSPAPPLPSPAVVFLSPELMRPALPEHLKNTVFYSNRKKANHALLVISFRPVVFLHQNSCLINIC